MSRRVYVYRNLHTGTWSVRALAGPDRGRVVAHPAEVFLRDAVFRVSAAGRDRVRSSGVRCVHAGVVGYVTTRARIPRVAAETVNYNPFRNDAFVRCRDGVVVTAADVVHFPPQPRGASAPLRAWELMPSTA